MKDFDYLIIGAGPAGLQLGYYFERAGRNYCILEAGSSPATFFKSFPRHRRLISINKVYTGYEDPEVNMRWDWNSLLSDRGEMRFKHYSQCYFPDADDFVRYCVDFAKHFNLRIQYGVRVIKISKSERFELINSQGDVYTCKCLIVATGLCKPHIPPIPGIELAENYSTVSVDPDEFTNKRVLIIGKGNSGFESAENLIGTTALIHVASPNPLKMAWRSHFVGHLRAVNNNILDTYQLKSQNAILDAAIEKIERRNGCLAVSVSYSHANGEREELLYDRVIVCAGFRFDDTIFDAACRPELAIHGRFPNQTSQWESTNVKDLYFAGTLMQARDYKKSTSGFVHGFRYNIRALHHIFEQRYHDHPWPSRSISATAEGLTQAVVERINRTSALWQQFGFLCDLIVPSSNRNEAAYYEELPMDYVHESEFGRHDHYYLVTLEYGSNHDAIDPFSVNRIERHDHQNANRSNFLHPVVRRFSGAKLLAEHHIIEDLQAEWRERVHIEPLLEFFQLDLAGGAPKSIASNRDAHPCSVIGTSP